MTVLILGASGFLGSSLATHFSAKGEEVVSLSFRPIARSAFLGQAEAVIKEYRPRAVINAGASQIGKDDPAALEELIFSNVFLPATLASMLYSHAPEASLINFGTSWQTGEFGESSPFNAYAASKAAAENFLEHFALAGLRIVTLRLYDTYGPNDFRNKLVNLIADALITRSELPMSSGGQLIDLTHIDDVIAAVDVVLALLAQEQGGVHKVFSVRSGSPVTVLDVLNLLKNAAGLEDAPFIKPGIYPYRDRERFALFADTPTPPGWSPRVELVQGILQMLDARRMAASKVA
jgi:CDP-3, 6-dideoxy-D-glycero-L-glycero-4-hexulose-4-reductase